MSKKAEPTAYGVVSLTCAIVSIFVLGIVFAPLAIITGAIGANKANNNKDEIMCILGIILGIVFTGICLFNFMILMSMR